MAYRTFVVLLLVVADCLSFNESRRVIYDQFDDDHLGYFVKTTDDHERTRLNAVERQEKKLDVRTGSPRVEITKNVIVTSLDPRGRNLEDLSIESVKNDSALPLHVTSTARQECVDGFQADENGTCQKVLAPKGEKSFKLRRRKRAEQQQPKLSYADVVKFGRNRPLTIPFKAEILTTTQKTPEVRQDATMVTTIKPVPSEAVEVSTATAVTGKVSDAVKKDEPAVTAIPNARKNEPAMTTLQSGKVSEVAPTAATQKAAVTTVPSVKPSEVPSSVATAATPSVTPINKADVTTAKPAAAPTPTKPSGLIIPTILTKIPTRVKSFLGDINKAFLSSEKSSIAAEAAHPNPAAKSPQPTRLRRWIQML